VLYLVFAILAIIINQTIPSGPSSTTKSRHILILLLGFLGLPWIIILNITKGGVLIKKALLLFRLARLPVCDATTVQQIQEERKKSAAFQAWLETRTFWTDLYQSSNCNSTYCRRNI